MSRHWFLTGASSGIGRHLAEIILASGMTSRPPSGVPRRSTTWQHATVTSSLSNGST